MKWIPVNCQELTLHAETADQLARVGVLPSTIKEEVGFSLNINDQPFVVTGYATLEEFYEAVERADLPVERFRAHPPIGAKYFLRLSTD